MVDHYEMRQAYLRALEVPYVDFKLHQCNICGAENNENGDYVFLQISQQTLRMWNCQSCLDEEKEEALVEKFLV